ncbi:MAG: hypothetical protein J2O48_10930 [Solirubrobacterales bacterium]|nr:hypothetical protein [Solirubrobacterales bacterium]
MRRVLLVVLMVFIAGVLGLTCYDVAHAGLTPLDVVAVVIVLFFAITIGGALTYRDPDE